jgi:hypothetical protein
MGDGTFQSPFYYGGFDNVVASADFDGDNDIDIFDGKGMLFNRLDIITDIDDAPDNKPLPKQIFLSQNYPNPFNPSTRINYTIPRHNHVKITINNLLGQEVATVVDEFKPPGEYSIVWDGGDFQGKPVASGVYFYRLLVGNTVEAKKMILLK